MSDTIFDFMRISFLYLICFIFHILIFSHFLYTLGKEREAGSDISTMAARVISLFSPL